MLQFENQKIKQIVRKVLPVVTLGAMLYSCASIGRPDGGPYDETPPRFIGSTPAAGALNNERTKISLMFDEFIKLEKATEKSRCFSSPRYSNRKSRLPAREYKSTYSTL